MEELIKKRNKLFNKKMALTVELKRVSESLRQAEVHISNGRYEQNQREEEK